MKRILFSLTATAMMLFGVVSVVSAGETYCDIDPVAVITTPAGNHTAVYVVNGGPAEHAAELVGATYTYTVEPADNGTKTRVNMKVLIANIDGHGHNIRTQVWTGPAQTGTLLSEQYGTAGTATAHQFTLDIP